MDRYAMEDTVIDYLIKILYILSTPENLNSLPEKYYYN